MNKKNLIRFINLRAVGQDVKKGFTLIELLIVIAIIGILSSMLMANYIGAQQRGRDAKRKSDLKQIQVALEQYRSDNGAYPCTITSNSVPGNVSWEISSTATTWIVGDTTSTTTCPTASFSKYMSKQPQDPLNTGGAPWLATSGYTYAYYSNYAGLPNCSTGGSGYVLVAQLEDKNDADRYELHQDKPCGYDWTTQSNWKSLYSVSPP